jgi:hypothetical protein
MNIYYLKEKAKADGRSAHDLREHCALNFMKALEALKKEHADTVGFESCRIGASPHAPDICEVCKLIAELEEVK